MLVFVNFIKIILKLKNPSLVYVKNIVDNC